MFKQLTTNSILRIILCFVGELLMFGLAYNFGRSLFSNAFHVYNSDISWGIHLRLSEVVFSIVAIIMASVASLVRVWVALIILAVIVTLVSLTSLTTFVEYPFRSALLLGAALLGIVAPSLITITTRRRQIRNLSTPPTSSPAQS